ncbi:transposase [Streptomyces bathyalis]|uniref:transposase n=1 Tax=Streptomyces bathyalis TaxID=2710756 RepID=UPI0018D0ACA4|nr:transposase [Streptomyces bathyalis]
MVPASPSRPQGGGRRRHGHREVLAAIVFVAISGCTWQRLPCASPSVHSPTRWDLMPRHHTSARAAVARRGMAEPTSDSLRRFLLVAEPDLAAQQVGVLAYWSAAGSSVVRRPCWCPARRFRGQVVEREVERPARAVTCPASVRWNPLSRRC